MIDISSELHIIRNNTDGEEVRDAIISAFRKINDPDSSSSTTNVGQVIEYDDYEALSDEEKNNGIFYFISDVEVLDGDEVYFGGFD